MNASLLYPFLPNGFCAAQSLALIFTLQTCPGTSKPRWRLSGSRRTTSLRRHCKQTPTSSRMEADAPQAQQPASSSSAAPTAQHSAQQSAQPLFWRVGAVGVALCAWQAVLGVMVPVPGPPPLPDRAAPKHRAATAMNWADLASRQIRQRLEQLRTARPTRRRKAALGGTIGQLVLELPAQ